MADNAEPLAKEFNEEQLQPAAEYIAKNFEKEARRLAKEVGPLAEGLPKAMRRAVELNKVCSPKSSMSDVTLLLYGGYLSDSISFNSHAPAVLLVLATYYLLMLTCGE